MGAYDWRRLGGEGFSNNSSGLSTEIEFSAASMAAIAAELTVPFGTSFVVFCEEDETCVTLRLVFRRLSFDQKNPEFDQNMAAIAAEVSAPFGASHS